jgi:DNA-binding MarR family transcriptional regulator
VCGDDYKIEESLVFLVAKAGTGMGKHLRTLFDSHGCPMPVEHWLLLVNLWLADGQKQQELANNCSKDKGTVARALDTLEEEQWIIRQVDEKDKRQKKVFLTEKGKALRNQLIPIFDKAAFAALNGVSPEDFCTTKRVLNTIIKNLCYCQVETAPTDLQSDRDVNELKIV